MSKRSKYSLAMLGLLLAAVAVFFWTRRDGEKQKKPQAEHQQRQAARPQQDLLPPLAPPESPSVAPSAAEEPSDPESMLAALGPKCVECARSTCATYLKGGKQYCLDFGDQVAAKGPAAGTKRADLCLDQLKCLFRAKCSNDTVGSCYCGTAAGLDCNDVNKANGACKESFLAGLEYEEGTDSETWVAIHSSDGTLAAGRANELASCLIDNGCADPRDSNSACKFTTEKKL